MERVRRGRSGVPVRIDAALHHQRRLDLERPALGHVGEAVGELEVDRGQSDRARARHVRDLHARRLEREDAGLRALRVRRKVDEDVEIVVGDALRGGALGARTR